MGEWISVQTSRELHGQELAVEAEEIERFPREEAAELAGLYERHGLPPDGALRLAESVMSDPERALGVMAREELGIDSDQPRRVVQTGGRSTEMDHPWLPLLWGGSVVPLVRRG